MSSELVVSNERESALAHAASGASGLKDRPATTSPRGLKLRFGSTACGGARGKQDA